MHLVPRLMVVCWTEPRTRASWTSPVRGQRLLSMVRGVAALLTSWAVLEPQAEGAKLAWASGKQGQRRTSRSMVASRMRAPLAYPVLL